MPHPLPTGLYDAVIDRRLRRLIDALDPGTLAHEAHPDAADVPDRMGRLFAEAIPDLHLLPVVGVDGDDVGFLGQVGPRGFRLAPEDGPAFLDTLDELGRHLACPDAPLPADLPESSDSSDHRVAA